MEFFDMFVFNNVKSSLEIIVYQPNKVVFKGKIKAITTDNGMEFCTCLLLNPLIYRVSHFMF